MEEVAYGIGKDKRIGPFFLQAGIIDGRNCYSLLDISRHSISYISMGRPYFIHLVVFTTLKS